MRLTVLPQQVKTRSGESLVVERKNWGKGTLALTPEVRIEPRHGGERDCTPGAELPDFRRSSPAGVAGVPPKLPHQTPGAELPDCSSGSPAALVGELWWQSGSSSRGSLAAVQQLWQGSSAAVRPDSLPGSHMANWQIIHLFLYVISLLHETSSPSPRPLVHKIVPLHTEGAPKLTRSFSNFQKCISHSKKHVQTYFKVCIRVAAPETQNIWYMFWYS